MLLRLKEGIEVLTGMPAGERAADGTYPEATVNFHVDKKLTELSDRMRKLSEKMKSETEEEDEEESEEQEERHLFYGDNYFIILHLF